MQQVIEALYDYSFPIGYAIINLIEAGKEDEQEYLYLEKAKISLETYFKNEVLYADIYTDDIPMSFHYICVGQKYKDIMFYLAEEGRTRTGKTDLVNLHKALSLIKKAIENKSKKIKKAPIKPSIQSIISKTEELFGFSIKELQSRRSTKSLSYTREYLSHELKKFGLTKTGIGNILHRSHSSIILYLDHYEDDFKYNQELKKIITK